MRLSKAARRLIAIGVLAAVGVIGTPLPAAADCDLDEVGRGPGTAPSGTSVMVESVNRLPRGHLSATRYLAAIPDPPPPADLSRGHASRTLR